MAPFDWPEHPFGRALDELGRSAPQRPDDNSRHLPAAAPGLVLGLERSGGGAGRWRAAMDWAEAPPPPPAPQPIAQGPGAASIGADLAAEVARELGFTTGMTARALTGRWRAFVWRNHPDRQPIDARERANARVALANALYDRVRRGIFSRQ